INLEKANLQKVSLQTRSVNGCRTPEALVRACTRPHWNGNGVYCITAWSTLAHVPAKWDPFAGHAPTRESTALRGHIGPLNSDMTGKRCSAPVNLGGRHATCL